MRLLLDKVVRLGEGEMNFVFRAIALLTGLVLSMASQATSVFINEVHYDNAGTATGEFIEIAGPAGTDLSGWSLVEYLQNTSSSSNCMDPATIIAAPELTTTALLAFGLLGAGFARRRNHQ